jgi:hypothetical protein
MSLTGGKRKVNKSLKAWVAFVKKVQKEEKLSYKDAIHRAKQRKDKGEKWMTGGNTMTIDGEDGMGPNMGPDDMDLNTGSVGETEEEGEGMGGIGGRRRRRTMRRSRGMRRGRGRTARRSKGRASRRH